MTNGFFLIGCSVTLLLCACGTTGSVAHYSPPSAAPVRDHVSNAQAHATDAKKAIEAAHKLAPVDNADLKDRLGEASRFIDALTFELTTAQNALKDYEAKVAQQTAVANRALDEKNAAITAEQKAEAQSAIDRKHAHRLKFYICSVIAALAFMLAFKFKTLFALLGPYGLIGGLAGIPALAVAFAWKFF